MPPSDENEPPLSAFWRKRMAEMEKRSDQQATRNAQLLEEVHNYANKADTSSPGHPNSTPSRSNAPPIKFARKDDATLQLEQSARCCGTFITAFSPAVNIFVTRAKFDEVTREREAPDGEESVEAYNLREVQNTARAEALFCRNECEKIMGLEDLLSVKKIMKAGFYEARKNIKDAALKHAPLLWSDIPATEWTAEQRPKSELIAAAYDKGQYLYLGKDGNPKPARGRLCNDTLPEVASAAIWGGHSIHKTVKRRPAVLVNADLWGIVVLTPAHFGLIASVATAVEFVFSGKTAYLEEKHKSFYREQLAYLRGLGADGSASGLRHRDWVLKRWNDSLFPGWDSPEDSPNPLKRRKTDGRDAAKALQVELDAEEEGDEDDWYD
ncbi:hypothetical protein P7C70_g1062, partial [Phenoliferia sp. Uapishka_3]